MKYLHEWIVIVYFLVSLFIVIVYLLLSIYAPSMDLCLDLCIVIGSHCIGGYYLINCLLCLLYIPLPQPLHWSLPSSA